MSQEGFYFESAEEALKFYKACEKAGAVTLEDMMIVMRQMVKDKHAKYIRDVDTFAKDYNVLKVTKKEPPIE